MTPSSPSTLLSPTPNPRPQFLILVLSSWPRQDQAISSPQSFAWLSHLFDSAMAITTASPSFRGSVSSLSTTHHSRCPLTTFTLASSARSTLFCFLSSAVTPGIIPVRSHAVDTPRRATTPWSTLSTHSLHFSRTYRTAPLPSKPPTANCQLITYPPRAYVSCVSLHPHIRRVKNRRIKSRLETNYGWSHPWLEHAHASWCVPNCLPIAIPAASQLPNCGVRACYQEVVLRTYEELGEIAF